MSTEPRFRTLASRVLQNPDYEDLRLIVEKEILHHDLLAILHSGGWLDRFVFHGGTSLRLCHGAPRLSEDLDFSAGPDFTSDQAAGMAAALEEGLAAVGLEAAVKPPRTHENTGVGVSTWRDDVETRLGHRNTPKQKIKIDVDTATARTREMHRVACNYDVLPDRQLRAQVKSAADIPAKA